MTKSGSVPYQSISWLCYCTEGGCQCCVGGRCYKTRHGVFCLLPMLCKSIVSEGEELLSNWPIRFQEAFNSPMDQQSTVVQCKGTSVSRISCRSKNVLYYPPPLCHNIALYMALPSEIYPLLVARTPPVHHHYRCVPVLGVDSCTGLRCRATRCAYIATPL